ncbi:helix-turn-helix transcriptional regulator [Phenylobacterium sp.]|uniref:helix-turn-helix transcriptional regulator n=1 Tax=Phenylobacterium sp. TaxID=1871053 RepID=UPI00286CB7DF|nr:helix-turn-helix transcriptional regulator [Phenylobacterium sp.]
MTTPFSEKLRLVLKLLSMSSARLASELETDKSVVSRWLAGAVQPSAHNLSRLSALVATRLPGFRTLDWERDAESLAQMFGAEPGAFPAILAPRPIQGLPLAIWDLMIAGASVRGAAYEGFFRSTRAHPAMPGRFVHDHGMIRRDEIGLLRLSMGTGGTEVSGWMLPLHNQLFSIACDVTSGVLLFGIFNGVGTARVDVFDGLTLTPSLDAGRTPTAMAMICERVADLSGDPAIDNAKYAELITLNPLAPEGSIPEPIRRHLDRDFGPSELAAGRDWLLSMPLGRSLSRGPIFEAPTPHDA